ncbi:MAG: hypothetical protein ACYSSP_10890 [Planctomycetota bacterium]|jgi:tetrahydromethanopterin S-methyltransferase subunit G
MPIKEVENLKKEIAKINENIESLWGAIEEDRLEDSSLAKESEDSAMMICELIERLEKMEKSLIYVEEQLENEKKKRKTLGFTVIICGGIVFSLMLCGIQVFWLAGVVFIGALVGASLYS